MLGATSFAAIIKNARPKQVRRLLSLLGGGASRKQFGRELFRQPSATQTTPMMWDEFLERLAMIWKPLVAGAALIAAAGSTVGVWLHFHERPKEMRLPGTVETQ